MQTNQLYDFMENIELKFPHSYSVEEPPEFSGTGLEDIPKFYIPRPTNRGEHDGLWLKIRSATGKSWIGGFAFGYQSPPAISQIISLPTPDRVCIISRGAAYTMDAENPLTWEKLPILPVIEVHSLIELQLVVFADFTR